MQFDVFTPPVHFRLWLPPSTAGLILSLLGCLAVILILWQRREEFRLLGDGNWIWFLGFVMLIIPANILFVMSGRNLAELPTLQTGSISPQVRLSLLAMLINLAVAYVFGAGPGLIASFVLGISNAWFDAIFVTDVFPYILWGTVAGACLNQTYRGEAFQLLRQPIIAGVISSIMALLAMTGFRLATDTPLGWLPVVDYIFGLWSDQFWTWILAGLASGTILQLIVLIPQFRRKVDAVTSSFYSLSLQGQFLGIVVPFILLATIASLFVLPIRPVEMSRERYIEEMARAANAIGLEMLDFEHEGRTLAFNYANDSRLVDATDAERYAILSNDLALISVFREILYLNKSHEILTVAPGSSSVTSLTDNEIAALKRESEAQMLHQQPFYSLPTVGSDAGYGISFIVPVMRDPTDAQSEIVGHLICRAELDIKTTWDEPDDSVAFVLDEYDRIISHPDGEQLFTTWDSSNLMAKFTVPNPESGDLAYDWAQSLEHLLIFVHPIGQTGQKVVVQVPYNSVLRAALTMATPLVIVQVLFGLFLMGAIIYITRRVTRPLIKLANAAERITMDDLAGEISIAGEDEVAQLGGAFELMRQRLQERLNDLSLLLTTTQKVSSTLDLEEGVTPILEAARAETGARVARMVILNPDGRPNRVFYVGEDNSAVIRLDRALSVVLVRRENPLVIQDVENAKGLDQVNAQLNSIAAFPVRIKGRTTAMLWVGLAESNAIDEARISFLTTLTHQAVALMENARLFQSVEGGRDRLAAILSSTTDAILVTDAENNVVLTNPAAKRIFELEATEVGKPVDSLGLPDVLVSAITTQTQAVKRVRRYQMAFPNSVSDVMSKEQNDNAYPSVEVPMPDGTVYYASIAPIRSKSGLTMGVVVVMRDVTHFKELDEMKSEFVSTVSHDLRRPLSYMRGYTTMLTMAGELNSKQQEYAQSILEGVEQMNSLINDLLNLRRVEAGVGVRREVCRLGMVLVEAVDAMRARANAKGVSLRLEPAEGAPIVMGDRTLLRQAIANLVDNAIKYTPSSGEVAVGLSVTEQLVTIKVKDTGIGIAPADQVRLFERFYRIQRSDVEQVQGTGLGLALVKSIIERHDGRVWVDSALDRGSTFYIELPLPRSEDITAN